MWTLIERGGVWVMLPLMGCSVVALGFVIERAVFWARLARGTDRSLVEEFLRLADRGAYDEAARRAHGSRDPVVCVLHCGLVHRNYDVASALQMAATAELKRMERFLPVLDTVITLAPLLGILGTVVGIISSFGFLSENVQLQDPRAVTGGIAQALLTTATGLVIAIATLVPHNYFRALADGRRHEMEDAATRLEIVLRKRGAGGGPPAESGGEGAPVPDETGRA
jgi:biopolymer transport protein ExbB